MLYTKASILWWHQSKIHTSLSSAEWILYWCDVNTYLGSVCLPVKERYDGVAAVSIDVCGQAKGCSVVNVAVNFAGWFCVAACSVKLHLVISEFCSDSCAKSDTNQRCLSAPSVWCLAIGISNNKLTLLFLSIHGKNHIYWYWFSICTITILRILTFDFNILCLYNDFYRYAAIPVTPRACACYIVILARTTSAPWWWQAICCRNMSGQWECFNVNGFKLSYFN